MVHFEGSNGYRPCGNLDDGSTPQVNAVTCTECLYHVITGELETTAYPLEVLQGIAAQLTGHVHRL